MIGADYSSVIEKINGWFLTAGHNDDMHH